VCNAPSPCYPPAAPTWELLPHGSQPVGCPGDGLQA